MTKTAIKQKAYRKMIIHSIQNATSEIHGILVGKSSSKGKSIEDVLPVCHSSPTKPILDMAFRLADSYLANHTSDLKIMGW